MQSLQTAKNIKVENGNLKFDFSVLGGGEVIAPMPTLRERTKIGAKFADAQDSNEKQVDLLFDILESEKIIINNNKFAKNGVELVNSTADIDTVEVTSLANDIIMIMLGVAGGLNKKK